MGKARPLRETYTPHTTFRPVYTHHHPASVPESSTLAVPTNSSFNYYPATSSSPPPPPRQPEEENPVTAIALTPKNVVTAHRSGHVTIHGNGSTIRPFRDERVVSFISHDGTYSYVALASTDGAIRIYDAAGKNLTHVLEVGGVISVVTFTPSGEQLLVGCDDGRIVLFDLLKKNSKPVEEVFIHNTRVTGIGFGPSVFVSVGGDGVIAIVELDRLTIGEKRLIYAGEPLVGVVVFQNVCITVGERCQLRLWDILKGIENEKSLKLPFVTQNVDDDDDERDIVSVIDMRINGPGRLVLSLSDQTLLFVNVSDDGDLQLDDEILCGNLEEIYDIARVSGEDGNHDFALATNSPVLWIMTFHAPNISPVPLDAPSENHGSWTCRTGLSGHEGIILSLDAKNGVLASGARDKTARLWEEKDGKWGCVAVAEGHGDAVSAVALSPKTEKFLVTGAADRMLKLWPITGRKQLSARWTLLAHEKDVNAVAISPDGKLIASGSQDRSVKMWTTDGKLRAKCTGHKRGIWSVSFSPVDRILASSSGDSTVRLWSIDGQCLRTLQGHMSGVLRAVFMNAGTQMITAGADGLLKVWLTRSGECGNTVDAHEDRIWALDEIDDGGVLISGAADGKVKVWTDATAMVRENERKRKEEMIVMGQAVDDATRQRNWGVAMRGALELGMSERLCEVVSNIIGEEADMAEMMREMLKVKECGKKEMWRLIRKLLFCCREWVSAGGGRRAVVGGFVVNGILGNWSVEDIVDGVGADAELVGVLAKQFDRHYRRIGELEIRCALLEHTVGMMRGLADIDGADPVEKIDDKVEHRNNEATHDEVENREEMDEDGEDNDDEARKEAMEQKKAVVENDEEEKRREADDDDKDNGIRKEAVEHRKAVVEHVEAEKRVEMDDDGGDKDDDTMKEIGSKVKKVDTTKHERRKTGVKRKRAQLAIDVHG